LYDRLFGWRNQTRTEGDLRAYARQAQDKQVQAAFENQYGNTQNGVDVGAAVVNRGTEHGARSTAYVFLAVLFFIGYWIVAGPGSYLFLAARKRRGLSWTVFGATALAATLLTLVLVKLLLGGGAEVRHVTLVRLVPDAPAADGSPRFAATMHGRVGLYIPKDGAQTVALAAPATERSAAVGPYAVHPHWLKADKDAGFTDTAKYFVNTDPILAGQAPSAGFPYRSTLKKLEGWWTGQVAEGIVGDVEAADERATGSPIAGKLTNKTGRDLSHAYLAFTSGWVDASAGGRRSAADRVLYLRSWKNGATIDAAAEWAAAKPFGQGVGRGDPTTADRVRGFVDPTFSPNGGDHWGQFWFGRARAVVRERGVRRPGPRVRAVAAADGAARPGRPVPPGRPERRRQPAGADPPGRAGLRRVAAGGGRPAGDPGPRAGRGPDADVGERRPDGRRGGDVLPGRPAAEAGQAPPAPQTQPRDAAEQGGCSE
jgi:hypothetical protein